MQYIKPISHKLFHTLFFFSEFKDNTNLQADLVTYDIKSLSKSSEEPLFWLLSSCINNLHNDALKCFCKEYNRPHIPSTPLLPINKQHYRIQWTGKITWCLPCHKPSCQRNLVGDPNVSTGGVPPSIFWTKNSSLWLFLKWLRLISTRTENKQGFKMKYNSEAVIHLL